MDKRVEIFKYSDKINTQIERCPEVAEIMQKMFDKLNSNGLSVSFESFLEITTKHIFGSKQVDGQGHRIYDVGKEISLLIKNLAIDSNPENSKVMGFKINREKLIDLMEVEEDDTKELVSLIHLLSVEDWNLFKYLEFDTKTAKVKTVADFAKKIEERLTIYADNERQIRVTAALLALIDALNGYLASYEGFDKPEGIDGLILDGKKAYQLDFERIKKL